MDNLQEIVKLLPDEACQAFGLFVNHQKQKKARKDLQLFELLRKEKLRKPAEYLEKLSAVPNTNAYHALRKRLFRQLLQFLVLQRMDADSTSASQLMGIISLCRYLYEQNNEALAWHYLKKAEALATENEQYELLHSLYTLQIEYSGSEWADPLQSIIRKREKNKKLLELEENAALASALIRQRLKEVRLESRQIPLDNIISKTLYEFGLHDSLYQRPKFLYSILSITRSAMLAKKDFYAFEPYILQQYRSLSQQQAFTRANHFYKLSILYMLCHVLYRNRKFRQALAYLQQFEKDLQEHQGAYQRKFQVQYLMLLAAVKSYLGESMESIQLLEESLENCSFLKEEERLQMLLNLGLYYFQHQNLKKANQISLRIGHTDAWCAKKLGKEWVMKKNLMELIIQYELGNTDLVDDRLRAFHQQYKGMYRNPLYKRVKLYLDFLQQINGQPQLLHDKTLEQKITNSLTTVPEAQEDLQAMTFYSWLKAKLHKRPFYEVLLETVQP
ncbi:hypothetical protein [Cesiribacter sp. SM1]|uniref:hypothetical protein n=1 Tax=Cesiribacter sp. SM1 TaxID=2861196 RepID=UPI001CD25A03|nr:hypothetical protein [Cesiribacter sp. SM1]